MQQPRLAFDSLDDRGPGHKTAPFCRLTGHHRPQAMIRAAPQHVPTRVRQGSQNSAAVVPSSARRCAGWAAILFFTASAHLFRTAVWK